MTAAAPPRPAAPLPGRALPSPTWTGSSAGALLHAVAALAVAASLALERPDGYAPAVFGGPKAILGPLPGDPLLAWAVVFAVPAVVVLAGRGRPWTRVPLSAVAIAWAVWGGGALYTGLVDAHAACFGGITSLVLFLGAWRTVAALGRRR